MRDGLVAVVGFVALMLLVGGATWFFTTHEQVTEEEEVGLHGLAAINDYLAAERTLEALGIPADTWYVLSEPPDYGDTVVVLSTDPEERERIHSRLDGWAWDGGHVVAVAVQDSEDPFMEAVSAELDPGVFRSDTTEYEVWDPAKEEYRWVTADLSGSLSTWRELDTWLDDDDGEIVAFSVVQGSGRLSLLADATFMDNEHIGRRDHAALMFGLLADDLPGQVVFVTRAGRDSLLSLALEHGWMVVISGATLLLGWMAAAAPRFGPMAPPESVERRSLLEHITAAGAFHWRHGHSETLLAPARRAALARLRRQHPDLGGLTGVALVRAIAEREQMDEELTREVLYGQPKGAARFTQIMQKLQTLGS